MGSLPTIKAMEVDVLEKYFIYLDEIKISKRCPIFNSLEPLQKDFGLTRQNAKAIFSCWLATFVPGRPLRERAERAKGLRPDRPTDIKNHRAKIVTYENRRK